MGGVLQVVMSQRQGGGLLLWLHILWNSILEFVQFPACLDAVAASLES